MREWVLGPCGWRHRPWWKVAINTVLRVFQPQKRKLVIYTRCAAGEPPSVVGYGIGLVTHERPEVR